MENLTTGKNPNDFKLLLREKLTRQWRKNPKYLLRSFALSLRTEASSLSAVLQGKQLITLKTQKKPQSLKRLIKFISLTALIVTNSAVAEGANRRNFTKNEEGLAAERGSSVSSEFRSPAPLLDPLRSSCRNMVRRSVCLVDAGGSEPRPCLPDSWKYREKFARLFDQYPDYLRKMMCHLKRIYIESGDTMSSSGAGQYVDPKDPNRILGGIISIRKSFIDDRTSLREWSSWFEQLSFGSNPKKVSVSQNLPKVETSLVDEDDLLYFIFAHEMGHLFDFANGINGLSDNSWTRLSWLDDFITPLPPFDFPLRKQLCFYGCNGKILSNKQQEDLYSSLAASGFVSIYASSNPFEDFADTFAFYVLLTERHAQFRVFTSSNFSYDLMGRLASDPLVAAKRKFIADFLASEIKYPGE